jgi:hypothetical protein
LMSYGHHRAALQAAEEGLGYDHSPVALDAMPDHPL